MAVAMPSHFIGRRQVEGDCRLLEQVSEGETVQLLDCSPFGGLLHIVYDIVGGRWAVPLPVQSLTSTTPALAKEHPLQLLSSYLLLLLPGLQLLGKLLVGVELLGQWDVSDALLETPTTTGPRSAPQQHILTPRCLEFSMINNVAHYDFNGHTIVPLSCIIQGSTQNNNKMIFVVENSGTFKFHDT
uniref:Uncharacterized protein n=1 Tax=Oryza nivara TaxID=4536 RepID=A0A0E0IH10_ORYNI